eukprot:1327230-Amphidinium_carterae.1
MASASQGSGALRGQASSWQERGDSRDKSVKCNSNGEELYTWLVDSGTPNTPAQLGTLSAANTSIGSPVSPRTTMTRSRTSWV